jgi:ribonuclease R
MQDHVGSEFTGVVSSVSNFGLFIRLDDFQIDGMIHISTLGQEYFHYDGAKQMLVGEHSRKMIRLGDKLTVQVASVSLDDRRINLVLAGEGVPDRYARRARGKAPVGKAARGESNGSGANEAKSIREQLRVGDVPGKKGKKPGKKGKSTKLDAKSSKASKKAGKKTKAKRPGKNARKRKQS